MLFVTQTPYTSQRSLVKITNQSLLGWLILPQPLTSVTINPNRRAPHAPPAPSEYIPSLLMSTQHVLNSHHKSLKTAESMPFTILNNEHDQFARMIFEAEIKKD